MCGPRTIEVRLRPDLEVGQPWAHVEISTIVRVAEIAAGWLEGRFLAEEVAADAEEALRASEAINRALELSDEADLKEVIRQLTASRVILGFPTLREAVAVALGVRPEDIVDIRLMWRVSAEIPEVARLLATDGDWGAAGELYVPEVLEAELRALPAEFELTGLGADLFPAAPAAGQRLQYTVRHAGATWGGWIREASSRLAVPVMVDRLAYRKVSSRWIPASGQGPELPAGLRQAIAQAGWCLLEMGYGAERRAREAELLRLLGL